MGPPRSHACYAAWATRKPEVASAELGRPASSSQHEEEEEEEEIVQPEWVIDHETFNLWELGVDSDSLPEEVKLTSETVSQLRRLREWAKAQR